MKHQTILRALSIMAKFNDSNDAKARGGRGIRAEKKNDRGELLIYDTIGFDSGSGGVMAKDVMEQLDTLKGVKGLDVRFNSPGGDVFEGKAVYEALKRFDCDDKVGYVDSLAASAASMILMACDRVVMSPSATIMVHRSSSCAMGNCVDMRSLADVLDLEDGNIAGTYAEKTGKSVAECLDLMTAETWMNAEKAVELGFADEINRKDEEDEDDEEDDVKVKGLSVAASNVVRLAAITQRRIDIAARARLASIGKSIEQGRASPVKERAGQPARK